jgi:hypothetical protein
MAKGEMESKRKRVHTLRSQAPYHWANGTRVSQSLAWDSNPESPDDCAFCTEPISGF